jgi:outer membrane biosynthesis protein TonB
MKISRPALLLSALLHGLVVVAVIVGLPLLPERDLDLAPPPIEVELVQIAEKTTPPPPKPPEKKPEPKPEPPKPEPARALPPPPPPPPPEPKPEKAVEAPKPEPLPAPEPKPAPKPVVEAPPAPPQPRRKPEPPAPRPEPEQQAKAFDPSRLAALINKMQKEPRPKAESEIKAAAPSPQPPSTASLREPLTISELDLIRRQFERCWSPPVGARDAANLVVRVRVLLNPDGSLRGPPELIDRSRMGDDFWRAAAESALRAVRRCEPLKDLPPGKYDRWRDIELTFNPKDMLG